MGPGVQQKRLIPGGFFFRASRKFPKDHTISEEYYENSDHYLFQYRKHQAGSAKAVGKAEKHGRRG
jgi:hypothetical protein